MNANFARALSAVLLHEGGFVNHPADPGGATNKGITLATFRKWVKSNATVDDLKAISPADVAKVYRKHYWNAVCGDDLPSGVDYAVFDYAVNSGPSRAAKALQGVLGVAQDGKIGPDTLTHANLRDPQWIVNALCDQRLAFLRGLKTWGTFGKGWGIRVSDVRDDAIQLTAKPSQPAPQPQGAPQPTPTPADTVSPPTAQPAPMRGVVGLAIAAIVGIGALAVGAWHFILYLIDKVL